MKSYIKQFMRKAEKWMTTNFVKVSWNLYIFAWSVAEQQKQVFDKDV